MNPNHPIYIISKGRSEQRLTARALDRIGVPFRIVIEPQEYDLYSAVIDPARILVLPFSNLGQGSIPARNWVWEHSISEGAERHWILDDNIGGFCRFNRNRKINVATGTIFRAAEDFVGRYDNVPMAGFNYRFFGLQQRSPNSSAIYINTRVYSCILLTNRTTHRWRGRYNEDTDLSIRFLKDGDCTILFNAFLANKLATMTSTGGNTEELYQDDGRLKMAESLAAQHPDVARVSWKFGRWQHHVDYSPFKRNKLIRKPGLIIPEGVNNYGMVLQELSGGEWKAIPPPIVKPQRPD
jgi:hypothetical protein